MSLIKRIEEARNRVRPLIVEGPEEQVPKDWEQTIDAIIEQLKTALTSPRSLRILSEVVTSIVTALEASYPKLRITQAEKSASRMMKARQVDKTSVAVDDIKLAASLLKQVKRNKSPKTLAEALHNLIVAVERLTWNDDGSFTFDVMPLQALSDRIQTLSKSGMKNT